MQKRVYQTRVHDIDELRQRLITVWCELEQRIVDDAIDQWRRRMLACVDAEGGHFERNLHCRQINLSSGFHGGF